MAVRRFWTKAIAQNLISTTMQMKVSGVMIARFWKNTAYRKWRRLPHYITLFVFSFVWHKIGWKSYIMRVGVLFQHLCFALNIVCVFSWFRGNISECSPILHQQILIKNTIFLNWVYIRKRGIKGFGCCKKRAYEGERENGELAIIYSCGAYPSISEGKRLGWTTELYWCSRNAIFCAFQSSTKTIT